MMDDLDRRLLDCLRQDARASTAALARKLQMSRSTVQARIRRLEETGVIAGYTVRLTEDFSARLIRAHVMLSVSPKLAAAVVHALRRMEGVRALHTISGVYDMIALTAAETMEQMDALIDRIGALEGVERTTTSILMTTKFER
ncbi:MAG: Lrp/AsnC family transcriptional regulator [Caenispirillum bisanense]|nr:Lrp/AsnC family transcriptional regulator [Caenispirillum bisanense]MCA1973733.1 Lrp/AsnC family transcriptional regulator [Caenispirillum sp.]